MRERERKIAYFSTVKIEATTGREMNTSKSLDMDLSVQMGTAGAYTHACSKVNTQLRRGVGNFKQHRQGKTNTGRRKSKRRGTREF